MNYSELTDFEINKLVAERLGLKVLSLDDTAIPSVRCDDRKNKKSFYADYCNNPLDAWPIIFENEINILTDNLGGSWYAEVYPSEDVAVTSILMKNPLRAAMIVYLMMGDDDG